MPFWLKQSTAVTIKMGPFVSSTDGVTPQTALTIAQADIRLTKNGGAFAQTHNAAGGTHDENGYYGIPLDTTDANTLGTLRVAIFKTGALPVWQDFEIVAANVYDSLIGGGAELAVNVDQWKTGAPNALIAGRVDANAGVVGDKTGYSLVASDNSTLQTGTAQGGSNNSITLSAGASAQNDIYNGDVIKIYGGTGQGQTRVIVNYNGTTKVATVDNNWAQNPDITSTYSVTQVHAPKTDAGQNVIVGTNNDKTGYTLSAPGIQAIWDALTAALTTVGSIGKLLVDDIDAKISSRSTFAGGPVASVVGDVGGNVDGNVLGSVNSVVSPVTVGTNNDKTGYALTAGERNSVADALLIRDWTLVAAPASRSVLNALRFIRNKFSTTATPGVVTIYKEDDTTAAYTKPITTDPTAQPIVQG